MATFTSRDGDRQRDFKSRLDAIRNPNMNHMSRTRTKVERFTQKAGDDTAGTKVGPRRKKKAYDGAYVAEPRRQVPSGFSLAGQLLAHVHNFVIDMDLTSLYPSIMLIMNLSPDTFVAKIIFEDNIDIPMYPYITFLDKADKADYKMKPTDFFAEALVGKHWWALMEIFFKMRPIDEILTYIGDHLDQFE